MIRALDLYPLESMGGMFYTGWVNKRKVNARLDWIGVRLAAVVAVMALGIFGFYVLINSRSFQFFDHLTSRVETQEKVVALTFDDGPSEATDEILAIMNSRGAKGTFYVIGTNIEMYPAETRALVAAGMELGNHSYSHQRMVGKSQAFIDQEIQQTNRLIREAGYEGAITFRPPFGKKFLGLPWYLQQHNIRTIMWDTEPDTYAETEPDDQRRADMIVAYTLDHVRPGSIVLLHPFWGYGPADVLALDRIIEGLQRRGYRLVTVGELLERE